MTAYDASQLIGYRFGPWYIPARMMPGLDRWVDDHIAPGDFLCAVLCNDLRRAVELADLENRANLPAYVGWLVAVAPGNSWGSPAAFESWLAARQP